jgi:hypothetical protein
MDKRLCDKSQFTEPFSGAVIPGRVEPSIAPGSGRKLPGSETPRPWSRGTALSFLVVG